MLERKGEEVPRTAKEMVSTTMRPLLRQCKSDMLVTVLEPVDSLSFSRHHDENETMSVASSMATVTTCTKSTYWVGVPDLLVQKARNTTNAKGIKLSSGLKDDDRDDQSMFSRSGVIRYGGKPSHAPTLMSQSPTALSQHSHRSEVSSIS